MPASSSHRRLVTSASCIFPATAMPEHCIQCLVHPCDGHATRRRRCTLSLVHWSLHVRVHAFFMYIPQLVRRRASLFWCGLVQNICSVSYWSTHRMAWTMTTLDFDVADHQNSLSFCHFPWMICLSCFRGHGIPFVLRCRCEKIS